MKEINLKTWNREEQFHHFSKMLDPYFGVTIPFDLTKAYQFSKDNGISFFGKYMHACTQAINSIENLKYRIVDEKVVLYDVIHASATIMREDKTFGFSFIEYHENLDVFLKNLESEKTRIESSKALFPKRNGLDCIHCSALPWLHFSGHKEPFFGEKDSVPKIAFSKVKKESNMLSMNVAISVNHALVDGYHVGLFSEKFQYFLNQ
ncbi:CatA-like O-acetyltransferase [Oceanihabitans sp. 2_MG-2023]|uniref:CatA-like O-acetyltransferase n=1 Tax=Oceanihabitans sp. 2_MG-2023 TaxID=3062661 RepID=UPI0026E18294|nr:CatA-like O-acetyltransferase [Oceanihabitans sp. 2_MG-2023]MDO6597970.1 CatA-like O-acetyltransferase [Oceanihabitans sp. 2_MG-2023]